MHPNFFFFFGGAGGGWGARVSEFFGGAGVSEFLIFTQSPNLQKKMFWAGGVGCRGSEFFLQRNQI